MAYLSIRGLDDQTMAELKRRATQENASVNALVLQLIDQGLGRQPQRAARQRHGDLDALAGRWSAEQVAEFEHATAAMGEIDPSLWK